jgi:hypothetical protein
LPRDFVVGIVLRVLHRDFSARADRCDLDLECALVKDRGNNIDDERFSARLFGFENNWRMK